MLRASRDFHHDRQEAETLEREGKIRKWKRATIKLPLFSNFPFRISTFLPLLRSAPRSIFKPGEFFQEGEGDVADGPVALLGDDELGFAGFFGAGFFVFFVDFRPNEQSNQVGVLFDRAGFAQVAQARFAAGTRFRLPV